MDYYCKGDRVRIVGIHGLNLKTGIFITYRGGGFTKEPRRAVVKIDGDSSIYFIPVENVVGVYSEMNRMYSVL